MKKSITFYFDAYDCIRSMSTDDKGRLFEALFAYAMDGAVTELPKGVDFAFNFIARQHDKDAEKYRQTCEKNKENSNKRFNPSTSTDIDRYPSISNDIHKDKDKDKDKENDKDKEKNSLVEQARRDKARTLLEEAKELLLFLNEKSGRNYEPVEANISLIISRLKEGFTKLQIRKVIARKFLDWGTDEKMQAYLRPKTLFNKTNFANYVGECVLPKEETYAVSKLFG